MEKHHRVSIAGALLVLAYFGAGATLGNRRGPGGCGGPPECRLSGAWRQVDSFDQGGNYNVPTASASSARADYIVGAAQLPGDPSWLWTTRRSLDRGETWETVDQFHFDPAMPTSALGAAVDSRDGSVYVAGATQTQSASFASHTWVVRKSSDDGKTWRIVDLFETGPGEPEVADIAVDGAGVVYAVGRRMYFDGLHEPTAVIRRSDDGGATWSTLELGDLAVGLRAVAATRDGQVFVGGTGKTPTAELHPWSVFHSDDGKSGWTPVDDQGRYEIHRLRAFADGRVLALGRADDFTESRWFVRQAFVAAPGSWSTVDDYRPLSFDIGFGNAQAFDATWSHGRFFTTGTQRLPGDGPFQFLTRVGNPPASTFVPSDTVGFPSGTGNFMVSTATATDPGDVLTAHAFPKSASGFQWVVRKMECR